MRGKRDERKEESCKESATGALKRKGPGAQCARRIGFLDDVDRLRQPLH